MPNRQRRCPQSDNDDDESRRSPERAAGGNSGRADRRLIWQTTGAVASNRREALMTWAGLRGPTPTNHEIAAAHHVALGTVNYYWTAALSRAASTITLTN